MKKLLLAAFPLLAVSAFAPFANKGNASEMKRAVRSLSIENEYDFGETFEVPTLVKDGVTFSSTVVYPDGNATRETQVVLNQSGTYEIHYTANVNGKLDSEDYSFIVQNQYYSFSGEKSFASYERSARTYDQEGLFVSLAAGETITFSEVMDLRNTTKADNLFKAFSAPTFVSIEDYSELDFIFTDVSDPTNFLRYVSTATKDGTSYPYSYWKAGGNGQDLVGVENGTNIHINNNFGTSCVHSYSGYYPGGQKVGEPLLNAQYDAANNAAYTNYGASMITDLDNTKYAPTPWEGFKTGMVKLTIQAKSYAAEMANFVIKEVRGLDITSSIYTDNEAPVITVDNPYEVLPNAVKGAKYPVFNATAKDNITSHVEVKANVYYEKNGKQYDVNINDDNTFDVNYSGVYKIVYEAVDGVGNVANKTLTIATTDVATPINIVPKAKIADSWKKGVYYTLPDFKVSGGVGNIETSYKVTYNGKPVEITDNKFLPMELGNYTVEFIAKDMTGKTQVYAFDVFIEYNDGVVFYDLPNLPKYFISGYGFKLPAVYGTDFGNNGNKVLADVDIDCGFVSQTVKSGTYFQPDVPNNMDNIKITYRAKDTELVYEIPCIKSVKGKELQLQNYFIGEGFELDMGYNDKAILKTTVNGNVKWEFANSVAAEGLSLGLSTVEGLSTFKELKVVLADKVNTTETVTVDMYLSGKIVMIKVGDNLLKTDKSFDANNTFTLKVSGNQILFDKSSITINKFDNGKEFTKFSSDFVYVSTEIVNGTVGCGYEIRKFDNQTICETAFDSIEPRITIVDSYGGFKQIGEVSNTARIIVSDVLDPNVSASVSAIDPNHVVIKDVNGQPINELNPSIQYSIPLNEYGQYAIKYVAKDSSDNEATFSYSIGVLDDVAPVIKITSDYTKSCKVGEAIVVPTFEVTDNFNKPEDIITFVNIKSPSHIYYPLPAHSNSLIASYAGEYEVIITALDQAGNMAEFSYVVTVK
ncbi:MAG: hypothetical protein MJ248_04650 [Bacilli bacterium]|nr:hypothetical protein [Bacilli bacterium]